MPQPNQGIAHYPVERTQEMYVRIPLDASFFFTLRIERKPPFQHTDCSRPPTVLAVEELPSLGGISPPAGIHGRQVFVPAEYDVSAGQGIIGLTNRSGKHLVLHRVL